MVLRKGLPAKLALTDADDTRWDYRNDIACDAAGAPRSGVTSPIGTNLVTGSASMNVSVAAFAAEGVRDNGVVKLANDGATNVLVGTAPVANSRIDVVAARQNDASATVSVPDANNTPLLYVIPGVAAASPAKPAVPDGSVELATILVSVGNTTTNAMTITQTARYTAGPGGVVPLRNQTEETAWNPAPGSLAYRIDTTKTRKKLAAGWSTLTDTLGAERARVTPAQSISGGGAFTVVVWDTYIEGTGWVSGSVFTAPRAGLYEMIGKWRTAATDSYAGFYINNVYQAFTEIGCTNLGSGLTSTIFRLAAGDAVVLGITHIAGGATTLVPGNCEMVVRDLGVA